ncbi:hypothetical protein BLNAU_6208 [Blattamonas nauphoetae]|uniref:Uncharacterized protein n=1 Tax=Blattamonas nauphoetae TaxID=2049346 RepID=A0ABQ9Y4N3_9EUKA|nr:hypothetical protein BLNAU_6208 [Blattamonas nauphoetae]
MMTSQILHKICTRFGITPNSLSIDTRSQIQSDPSLFIHLFAALFTFLPNSTNFHLLPLFTTILQRHPPSLPHLLSSPLWLSLPSILASPPQSIQSPHSPSTLQTQPQPSPKNDHQIQEQSHLRPVLAFVNSILQLSLTSSPPTPIPNKTLLSSSLSTLSSHPDPLVNANSGCSLLLLNKLDCVGDETTMPVDELVAQRDALRAQTGEKDGEITKLMEIQKQKDEEISAKDTTIHTLTTELHEMHAEGRKKDDALRQANETIRQQAQQNKEKDDSIRTKDQIINEKDAQMKQKDDRITEMLHQLEGKDAILTKKDEDMRNVLDTIRKKDTLIIEKDAVIRQKDSSISTLTRDCL